MLANSSNLVCLDDLRAFLDCFFKICDRNGIIAKTLVINRGGPRTEKADIILILRLFILNMTSLEFCFEYDLIRILVLNFDIFWTTELMKLQLSTQSRLSQKTCTTSKFEGEVTISYQIMKKYLPINFLVFQLEKNSILHISKRFSRKFFALEKIFANFLNNWESTLPFPVI